MSVHELTDPIDDRAVVARHLGELEACLRLRRRRADLVDESSHDLRPTDLVELVDDPQDTVDVLDPEAPVEALGDLAVVHEDADLWHTDPSERGQRLGHDERHLDLEVVREVPRAHDVDVRLHELTEAAVLRTLATPHLLDLVALERKREVPCVLQDVARERHGQVEVQTEPLLVGRAHRRLRVVLALEPAQDIDLLGGLSLAQQLVERLDRARLDASETVQLERLPDGIEDVLLHDAVGRKPFGEA